MSIGFQDNITCVSYFVVLSTSRFSLTKSKKKKKWTLINIILSFWWLCICWKKYRCYLLSSDYQLTCHYWQPSSDIFFIDLTGMQVKSSSVYEVTWPNFLLNLRPLSETCMLKQCHLLKMPLSIYSFLGLISELLYSHMYINYHCYENCIGPVGFGMGLVSRISKKW